VFPTDSPGGQHVLLEERPSSNRLVLDPSLTRNLRVGLVAVVVLALAGALLLAWRPWAGDAAVSAASRTAGQRDAALKAATEGLLALNTIDYRHIGETVDHWAKISDGALAQQIRAGRSAVVRRTKETRTTATATLIQSAVSAFDAKAGTATVIALLSLRSTTRGGKATTTHPRFRVLVQRKDAQWKLSFFEALPVSR
jgi:Mce-associated membrane protein